MTRTRAGKRTDSGMTLMEVLIAIAIMGIGIGAVVATWGANIKFSQSHRKLSDAQAVLISGADRLNSRNRTLVPCTAPNPGDPATNTDAIRSAYQATINAALFPPYADWTVTVGDITYWDGTNYGPGCWYDRGFKLQKIQLTATSPEGSTTKTIEVVKGDE
jgi:prepilin-type N-terminal cleavage/methylation domain-containing protein